MAFYVNSRRRVYDEARHGNEAEVIDYFCDSETDVEKLPKAPQIKKTSSAFVPSTGALFVLMSGGWVRV